MKTAFALDWISATTKIHGLTQVMKRFAFGIEQEEWISENGKNGYQHAVKHPYGHVISWSNERDDMGINCLFTGLPLKELFDRGHDTLEIARWMQEEGFKFRRLDLALDVFEIEIDLEELQRLPFKGSVNKLPRLIKNGPNCEEGATLYIGSDKSDKFIRIYDKAGQLELEGVLWTRFELETRDKVAIQVGARIAALDDLGVAQLAKGMMRHMWNPDSALVRAIMDATPEKVSSTKDVNHRTYDWLMGTVSLTMAKVILELPHRDVMRTFEQEVQKHIREIAARAMKINRDNEETLE